MINCTYIKILKNKNTQHYKDAYHKNGISWEIPVVGRSPSADFSFLSQSPHYWAFNPVTVKMSLS